MNENQEENAKKAADEISEVLKKYGQMLVPEVRIVGNSVQQFVNLMPKKDG